MNLEPLTPLALALPLLILAPVAEQSSQATTPIERTAVPSSGTDLGHSPAADALVRRGSAGARLAAVDVGGAEPQPADSRALAGVGQVQRSRAAFWTVIDPVADVGFVHARWKDRDGRWAYTREALLPMHSQAHSQARPADGELSESPVPPPPRQRGLERAGTESLITRVLHL